VPPDLDVHLICDNDTTHKHPTIQRWLAAHPVPHALHPDLLLLANQVERWFGLLTDEQLRRGAHRSVQAPEKDLRTWIDQWNSNPKPFTWTKTTDEILDRLASYLQRIPGAGHEQAAGKTAYPPVVAVPVCGRQGRPPLRRLCSGMRELRRANEIL